MSGTGDGWARLGRAYRLLLAVYPDRFRDAYAADMTRAFLARSRRILAERGRLSLAIWVARAVLDAVGNGFLERIAPARGGSVLRNSEGPARGGGGPARPPREPLVRAVLGDVRFAARTLRRRPALTLTLVLTLALGTGATTAFFSVLDAALIRPLPYPEPDRLVLVQQSSPDFGTFGFAPPYLADLRDGIDELRPLAGFSPSWELTLTGLGEPRMVVGAYVSDGLFDLLGTAPVAGRGFDGAEHALGGPRSVLVSEGFWIRHFGPSTPLAGQTLTLDGAAYGIVGILPPVPMPVTASTVSTRGRRAEIWLPFATNPYAELRSVPVMNVLGRLPDGGSIERVRSRLASLKADLSTVHGPADDGATWTADRLRDVVTRDARPTVWTLFGAAVLLLAMACANVANLLLAHASTRGHELAVRRSLGADRARILRQLLTESLILAVVGCATGLALGAWLTGLVPPQTAGLPPSAEIRVDARLGLFAAFLSLATALFFGLAPALQGARGDTAGSMRTGGRADRAGIRTRRLLMSTQVALAVLLLVGAGLLGRSLWTLTEVDPGFRADGLIQVPLVLNGSGRDDPESRRAFLGDVLPALRALPGVERVAAVNRTPLSGGNVFVDVEVEGSTARVENGTSVDRRVATPDYFEVMGTPVVAGRAFELDDLPGSPVPAAVVNEAFVRRFWPEGDGVGRRLRLLLRGGPGPWLTVVGVVGDVRHHGLEAAPQPEVYVPYAQASVESMVAVVRARLENAALLDEVRRAVWRFDPDLPLDDAGPVASAIRASTAEPRLRALVLSGFAAIALALATVGIHGVVSYSVQRRMRETGVRIALGAHPGDIVARVVGEGVRFAGTGALAGLLGALLLSRLLTGFLYGVRPTDPLTFLAVGALTLLAVLGSCLVPAFRAGRVDPVAALRED